MEWVRISVERLFGFLTALNSRRRDPTLVYITSRSAGLLMAQNPFSRFPRSSKISTQVRGDLVLTPQGGKSGAAAKSVAG